MTRVDDIARELNITPLARG